MRMLLDLSVEFLLFLALYAAIGRPLSIVRAAAITAVVIGFRIHARREPA